MTKSRGFMPSIIFIPIEKKHRRWVIELVSWPNQSSISKFVPVSYPVIWNHFSWQ